MRVCDHGIYCVNMNCVAEADLEDSATYPVISQRCQTLSYPLFGVPVTDCDVESEDDEHAQENGPLDNDAGLVMWTC